MTRYVAFHIVTGHALHAAPTAERALAMCAAEVGPEATEVLDAGNEAAGRAIIDTGRPLHNCRHLPVLHRATFYDAR